MATLSLKELKALNEQEEKEKAQPEPEPEAAEITPEPEPEPEATEPEPEGEPEAEGEESSDWMKAEGEAEHDPKFTDSDVANVRRKWQGRARAAEGEAAELRKKVEELEKKLTTPVQTPTTAIAPTPKRDAYKSDEEYLAALTEYQVRMLADRQKSESAAAERTRAQQEELSRIEQAVDEHYVRVDKLAQKSGIKPETYQAAELKVRNVVEANAPRKGKGDLITDFLISSMGEGSEKVIYNLGVNDARRNHLTKLLKEDPTFVKAAVYLGELKTQLTAPVKKASGAPPPIDDVQGDRSGKTPGGDLKRKYDDAHKKGDIQAALGIKRQAKGLKIDTSAW